MAWRLDWRERKIFILKEGKLLIVSEFLILLNVLINLQYMFDDNLCFIIKY